MTEKSNFAINNILKHSWETLTQIGLSVDEPLRARAKITSHLYAQIHPA
jgi:hypothetical protein